MAACGSNSTDKTDTAVISQPDGGAAMKYDTAVAPLDVAVAPIDVAPAIDTTPAGEAGTVAEPLVWVVVQDTQQKACSTNGPGADIDAVALWDAAAGAATGWGMVKTAKFTANPGGNACENADCTGGNCKYAAIGTGTPFNTTYTAAMRVAWTEGPNDAKVNEKTDDSGYFSLNAGTLQIQIADLTGVGPVQLKSKDMIKVFEVDKTYVTSGDAFAGCVCLPETYTVTLQSQSGNTSVALKPFVLAADNTTCDALTATSTDGCGTTVFLVP
jgi:hypothetical protein